MAKRDQTAIVDVGLRLREGLRARVEQSAKQSGYSMNWEMVRRLERSFDRQDLLPDVLTLAFGQFTAPMLLAVANNEHGLLDLVRERVWHLQREGNEFEADLMPPPPTDEEFENMKRDIAAAEAKKAKRRGKS